MCPFLHVCIFHWFFICRIRSLRTHETYKNVEDKVSNKYSRQCRREGRNEGAEMRSSTNDEKKRENIFARIIRFLWWFVLLIIRFSQVEQKGCPLSFGLLVCCVTNRFSFFFFQERYTHNFIYHYISASPTDFFCDEESVIRNQRIAY